MLASWLMKHSHCSKSLLRLRFVSSINFNLQKSLPKEKLRDVDEPVAEPEPSYDRKEKLQEETVVHYPKPFKCQYGRVLPELHVSYEAWGNLNEAKTNTVLIQHGLSASPHARSHLTWDNSAHGWWEKFIGPGLSIDTNRYFVICVNFLGSCYGTTGPSSINPETGKPYGGDFPIVSLEDMVKTQFLLLQLLGIHQVYAVVGSSLGGLASFLSATLFPSQIDRIVSISGGGNSPPTAIAYRYLQRVAMMMDPKWNNGHYYDSDFPLDGAKLARKIATLTYRSGPEWDQRFKTMKIDKPGVVLPRYHDTEFLIEDYIRHQGETFIPRTKYDPNSLIYLSKAMDIFDIGENYDDGQREAFSHVKCPTLVMGASSDILYPATKQIEAANLIREGGNPEVTLKITEGHFGHDTFLLDVDGMGKHMKKFLEA